jgi:hypothetical protein
VTRIDVPCFVGNEIFAHLTIGVTLPFFPTPNLSLVFPITRLLDGTEQKNRMEYLAGKSVNPTGVIVIESVAYLLHPESDGTQVIALARAQVADSEPPISAYSDLMQEYYGFDKDVF